MKNKITLRFGVLAGIVGLATITRIAMPPLLGHPSNFAPIGALALFSGCYFAGRIQKFLVPLLAVWMGDIAVTAISTGKFALFYEGFYWQYACYALFVIMGMTLGKGKSVKPLNVAAMSLTASLIFFFVTNFGCWIGYSMYPHTFAGLMTCYAAGIPFFGGTVAGDLFYSALMFGAFELAQRKFTVLSLQKSA
jgi:hypothetical protein